MNNTDLVKFALEKLGTEYIMGTNGRIFTKSMYNDLTKRNPAGWFKATRLPTVKKCIGSATTDCHGLIEWFVREQTGKNYDVTADRAYVTAKVKGAIKTIPEIPGLCVRYPGHVGIYIGNGYAIEARGFGYGVCVTKLSKRSWTHWYQHPIIEYGADNSLPAPEKVNKLSCKYDVAWLQLMLNRQLSLGHIKISELVVDGEYGKKTAAAVLAYRVYKKWTSVCTGYSIGLNTIKALLR